MARFLEYLFIYGLVYLFGGDNPWLGVSLVLGVFLLINLVDNATARVRAGQMVRIVYALALTMATANIVGMTL